VDLERRGQVDLDPATKWTSTLRPSGPRRSGPSGPRRSGPSGPRRSGPSGPRRSGQVDLAPPAKWTSTSRPSGRREGPSRLLGPNGPRGVGQLRHGRRGGAQGAPGTVARSPGRRRQRGRGATGDGGRRGLLVRAGGVFTPAGRLRRSGGVGDPLRRSRGAGSPRRPSSTDGLGAGRSSWSVRRIPATCAPSPSAQPSVSRGPDLDAPHSAATRIPRRERRASSFWRSAEHTDSATR
jgi:hypothetical protein